MKSAASLRAFLEEAAAAAPPATGLLAAVRRRSIRRRRRHQALIAGFTAVVSILAIGLIKGAIGGGTTSNGVTPVATTPASPTTTGLLPLVAYQPPTFPYHPDWAAPSDCMVQYDRHGVPGLGVTGELLQCAPEDEILSIVFVSSHKPVVPGATHPISVRGRAGHLVSRTPVPLYKNDGTLGSVLYWKDASGRWISLIFGPSVTIGQAQSSANQLSATPISVFSDFGLAKVPQGMRIEHADQREIVLSSDRADVPNISLTASSIEPGPDSSYRIGDPSLMVPVRPTGRIEIEVTGGFTGVDLSALAQQITVDPTNVFSVFMGG